MGNTPKELRFKKILMSNWIACGLYSLFLISSCLYSFEKPLYNWDMLAYMAIVEGAENSDPVVIHNKVYDEARRHVPADAYARLVDTLHPVRKQMLTDAAAFNKQLVYYTVKPLYTGLVYVFYKAGISLTAATVLPSVIAYFFTGVLLFYWLAKYLNMYAAILCSIFIMLMPALFNSAKLSTPDCLSSFLLFTAMYFILERRKIFPVFLFLLLSIFARVDNIVACFLVVTLLAITTNWGIKISKKQYALMAAAFVAVYFTISYSCIKYGWNILFYPSFAQHLGTHPGSGFSITGCVRFALSQLITGLYFSNLIIYLLLLAFVFINTTSKPSKLNFDQSLAITIFLIIVVRFMLLPEIDDRFNAGWYLTTIMLLVRKLFGGSNAINVAQPQALPGDNQ